ncbi:hypothetical protein PV779_28020 [Streptomyces sp. ID01-9D]|nr:hypothetical protein [Streptomyces sp. ID01-9D]
MRRPAWTNGSPTSLPAGGRVPFRWPPSRSGRAGTGVDGASGRPGPRAA